jgi:uncharacterized protein YbjQ (UPF0145 family)
MLIVTSNDVPGYEITRVYGEVFGLTVRSRHIGSQIGAGFKSLVGGELRGQTQTLIESRHEAMARLVGEAQSRGANAIIAMRFDTSSMGDLWAEVCAYGTAVTVVPVTDDAKAQVAQAGQQQWQGQPGPGGPSAAGGGGAPGGAGGVPAAPGGQVPNGPGQAPPPGYGAPQGYGQSAPGHGAPQGHGQPAQGYSQPAHGYPPPQG